MPNNYIDVWTSLEQDENDLKTPGTLFGSLAKRAWFVREAYIKLYDDIMNDQRYHTQIVNGTAGIGKSSFLLYVLARVRFTGKSALLHYHRNTMAKALTIFFPGGGGVPVELTSSSPTFIQTFESWYQKIGEEQSIFFWSTELCRSSAWTIQSNTLRPSHPVAILLLWGRIEQNYYPMRIKSVSHLQQILLTAI
jgi:hypothetical protein